MTNEQKIAVKRYGRKKIRETSILTKRNKAEKVLYGIIFVIFVIYSLSLIFRFCSFSTTRLKARSNISTIFPREPRSIFPTRRCF